MLKRIGTALHFTKLGNLVVKLDTVPPLYIPVYTYSMRRVGTLYDVIGPVKSPYGLVKPVERSDEVLGAQLYAREQDLRRRRGR